MSVLKSLAQLEGHDDNRVMGRDAGHFVKRYDDLELNRRVGLSEMYFTRVTLLWQKGIRLMEFDGDAPMMVGFPAFEH